MKISTDLLIIILLTVSCGGILIPNYCNPEGCFYLVNGTSPLDSQQITLQMETGNYEIPLSFSTSIVDPGDLTWFNVTMLTLNLCLSTECNTCTLTTMVEERAQLNYTISLPGVIAGQPVVLHNDARTAVSVYGNLFYFSKEQEINTTGLFSNSTGSLEICPEISACSVTSPNYTCPDPICPFLLSRNPILGTCLSCTNTSIEDGVLSGVFNGSADFWVDWHNGVDYPLFECTASSGVLITRYEIDEPGILPPVALSNLASFVIRPIIYEGFSPQHFQINGTGICKFSQYPSMTQPDGCISPVLNYTIGQLRYEGIIKLPHNRNCLSYSYTFSEEDGEEGYLITIRYSSTCVSSSVSVVSSSQVCVCELSPCECKVENPYAKIVLCENGLCESKTITYITDPDCSPWCGTLLSDLPWWLRWLLLFLFIGVGVSVLVFFFGTLGMLKIFTFPLFVLYKILKHPVDFLMQRRSAGVPTAAAVLCILLVPINCQVFPVGGGNVTACDNVGCYASIVTTFDFQGSIGDSHSMLFTYKDVEQNLTITLVDMYYAYPLARLYTTQPVNLTYSCHCECPDGSNHYCDDNSTNSESPYYASRGSAGTASGCTWSSFGSGHWCCGVSYSLVGQQYDILEILNANSLYYRFQVDVGKGKCEFEWIGLASFYSCFGIKFTLTGALGGPLKYNGGGYLSGTKFLEKVNAPGQFDMTLNGWYQKGEPLSKTALLSAFATDLQNCYDNIASITTNYWDISVQGNPLTTLSAFGIPEVTYGSFRIHPLTTPALQISVIGNLTLPISLSLSCPVVDQISTTLKNGGYPDYLYVIMHSTCGSGSAQMSFVGFTPLQGCTPNFVGSEDITCALPLSSLNQTINGKICAEGMTKSCKSFNITLQDNQWVVGTSQHEVLESTEGPQSDFFSPLSDWWKMSLIGGASLLILIFLVLGLVCFVPRLFKFAFRK